MLSQNFMQDLEELTPNIKTTLVSRIALKCKSSFKSRSRRRARSSVLNHHLTQITFLPQTLSCHRTRTLLSLFKFLLRDVTDPIDGPDFNWTFPVKCSLLEEPLKGNALAQSLCIWQSDGVPTKTLTKKFYHLFVKAGICKFRHLHVPSFSALNGAGGDPAKVGTRAWGEAYRAVLRSPLQDLHTPLTRLPNTLLTITGAQSPSVYPKAQFQVSGSSWNPYALHQNRKLLAFQSLKLQETKCGLNTTLIILGKFFKVDLQEQFWHVLALYILVLVPANPYLKPLQKFA